MLAVNRNHVQSLPRVSLANIDGAVSARLGTTRVAGNAQPAVFNRQIAMYLAKCVGLEHHRDRPERPERTAADGKGLFLNEVFLDALADRLATRIFSRMQGTPALLRPSWFPRPSFDVLSGLCQYWHVPTLKNLAWLADSRSNVKSFPGGVQGDIGCALYAAQLGELRVKAKPLHGLGSQVMESPGAAF